MLRHSEFALEISPGVMVCSLIAGERRFMLSWVFEVVFRECGLLNSEII